jgi:hypothetical protein
MAIGRVPGAALLGNLDRQGLDLSFTTESATLLQLDFTNYRLGINTSTPQQALDVAGNILVTAGDVYTSNDLLYNIGSETSRWNTIYVGQLTSAAISGLISTPAQPNITSVGALNELTVSGDLIVQSSVVPSGNIAGNIGYEDKWWSEVYADTINASNINGTILTSNQPNITNLGNITVDSISTGGNVVIGGNINGATITADSFIQNGRAVLDDSVVLTVVGDVTGSGTYSNIAVILADSGVIAGVYGSADDEIADTVPKITVDSKGRITSIANVALTRVGNISFIDTTISTTSSITLTSATDGDITLTAGGAGIVKISGNDAIAIPVGSTLNRPAAVGAGYLRYNTDLGTIEFYNGVEWTNNQSAALITSQTIVPDGITNEFVLYDTATTTGVLVSINGTMQQPTTAYTVNGKVITFTEVPAQTDIVEVRAMSLIVSSVTAISDGTTRAETDSLTGEIRFINNNTETLKISQTGAMVTTSPLVNVLTSEIPVTIDSYDTALYRTAKYIIQSTHSLTTESCEVLVTHDGISSYMAISNVIGSGITLGNISTTISESTVLIQYTATSANTSIRLSKNYILI